MDIGDYVYEGASELISTNYNLYGYYMGWEVSLN